MKLSLIVLSLCALSSVTFADFPAPPPFTMLHCVKDLRAAAFGGGVYTEILVHRIGEGPYEVVQWEAFVPPGQAFPSGVRRKVLAAQTNCNKAYQGGDVFCHDDNFDFSLQRKVSGGGIGQVTEVSYEAKWTGGAETFGNSAAPYSTCHLLE